MTCCWHLPVVTVGARLPFRSRRYYVRCWYCSGKWGPVKRHQAINISKLVGGVSWSQGYARA